MRDKICILIQTNDDYDWLWKGIFLSWKLNWDWEEFNFPVYVITETKDFNSCHKDADFNTINVGAELNGPSNFSTKLIRGLNHLKEKGFTHILYAQDDSWPYTSPDSKIIKSCMNLMIDENIDCFYIHENRAWFPFTVKDTGIRINQKMVRRFVKGSRFYYNHGNAIWNIDSLLSLQREGEGPYENEANATTRCWESLPKSYLINYPWYDQEKIHWKGEFKESGLQIVNDLIFRYAWETRPEFMYSFIANDGSIIPIKPDDPYFDRIEIEEHRKLFGASHGYHFSNYAEL